MKSLRWEEVENQSWRARVEHYHLSVMRGQGGYWYSICDGRGTEYAEGVLATPDLAKTACAKSLRALALRILAATECEDQP